MAPGSWIRDGEKIWIRIQDEHPRQFFPESRMIPNPVSGSGIFLILDPGSGMEKFRSGIRINIPDPQHWWELLLESDIPIAIELRKNYRNMGITDESYRTSDEQHLAFQ
jgi:hypothetical protein